MEQAAFLEKALVLLAYLAGIVGTIFTVIRQIKKDRKDNEEKFAKKDEVNKEFETMDKRIDKVEKTAKENRIENIAAHKEIKDDITKHIDTRFDDLKDLIRTLKAS